VLAVSGTATALEQQSATFNVPLNLTGLSPDIGVVRVTCTVVGAMGHSSITVIDGKVVTKATIKVVLDAPDGGTKSYSCSLDGYSRALSTWSKFEAASPDARFRLSPTPQPNQGSFVW
jgi:hypothetical protein